VIIEPDRKWSLYYLSNRIFLASLIITLFDLSATIGLIISQLTGDISPIAPPLWLFFPLIVGITIMLTAVYVQYIERKNK